MSGASETADKLQVMRERLIAAATPADRVDAALAIGWRLWFSDPAAARPFLEQAVAESEQTGATVNGWKAVALLSELLRRSGDLDGCARCAERIFRDAEATGDRSRRACAVNMVGLIHQERGEFDRAVECFEESLQTSRETGFAEGERSALNQLADICARRGELDKALVYFRQCLEMSTSDGDVYERAVVQHNIGWTLASLGRWIEAAEHFHQTIALCEQHGFHDGLFLSAQMGLGELALKRSDCDNAIHIFGTVVEAARNADLTGQFYRQALSKLGWTHYRAGNVARAEEILGEAARLNEAAGDRESLATVQRQRAELALDQGQFDAAGELLAQAMRHAIGLSLRVERGEVLRVQALLAGARSKTNPELALFAQAEATLDPLGDTFELGLVRLEYGRRLAETGQSQQALPLLRAAARTFRRLSVVREAEEVNRLLYRLEVNEDRDTALTEGLSMLAALDLAPETFIERALAMVCDSLRFEQGAILAGDRSLALKGQPDLTRLPRLSSLTQTDISLVMPVREDRRLLGVVWLLRKEPLAARTDPRVLATVSRALAPSLSRLAELEAIEPGTGPQIPGLRFRGIVGRSREVLEVLRQVPRAAAAVVPVLVQGETGTGKELVARALHESGARADGPFVPVNCAAIPESMLEAEFFGVETGAATGVVARLGKFELAAGGTIFLDEIGDMSPTLQAKLVRAIEDKTVTRVGGTRATPVDAWVIAATNMDLDTRSSEGRFREDLLYRLNGFRFVLPPLRRRREDIPVLTDYFIVRTAREYNRPARRAGRAVAALFAGYSWPGNIRQLQHVVRRAVILADGDTLQVGDLPSELRVHASSLAASPAAGMSSARRRAADEAERAMLVEALTRVNGKVSKAIKLSGYSRTHFYRLLRKHHIAGSGASD